MDTPDWDLRAAATVGAILSADLFGLAWYSLMAVSFDASWMVATAAVASMIAGAITAVLIAMIRNAIFNVYIQIPGILMDEMPITAGIAVFAEKQMPDRVMDGMQSDHDLNPGAVVRAEVL